MTEKRKYANRKKYLIAAVAKRRRKIKLMAIGEGAKITNFLKEIEKTAPLMRVNDLKINQEKELDEAEIGLNYYFLPLPKTLGKTEQSVSPITPEEEKVFEKINEFTLMETIGVSTPAPLGKSDLFNY